MYITDGCLSDGTVIPSSGDSKLTIILEWPETNIGVIAEADCECGTLGHHLKLKATRYCGGSFTDGALWDIPDVTQCNFSDLARDICSLNGVSYKKIVQQFYNCNFCM